MMKTLRGFAALALAASMIAVGVPAVNANTGSNLTPAAEAAFADVGRCLASGKDKRLSVQYLIDDSGSLEWTDPEEKRREILSGSFSQLGGFAAQGVKVEASIAKFDDSAYQILDWTEIDSQETADVYALRLGETLTNDIAGGRTDWEAGLRLAFDELSSKGDSCKMLIWFTDGGINPDNSLEGRTQGLSNLCRPGIGFDSLGSSSDFGLMQNFREAGIPLFGVLFNNTEASNPNRAADGDALEAWTMSFMQALVEGRGQVAEQVLSDGSRLSGGPIDCAVVNSQGTAPPEQTNGAFLNAEDPVALAYQFLKLSSQISGGSLSQIRDGKFTVPPGTAKFEVLVAGTNWQLSGPSSSNITASNTSPSAAVSPIESAGAAALVVRTVNNPDAYGEWSIETFGANAELVVYPGLTFELDRDRASKILSDYPNTISGRITRTAEFAGEPIDLTEFGDYTISLAYLTGDSWVNVEGVTVDSNSRGDFAIENFSPPSGQDLLEVQLTLDLGPSFNNVESRFSLEVQDQQTLARAETDNLRLSNLIGPNGLAEGVLMLQGPNLADSSEFCFAAAPERLDDNQTGIEKVDRLSGFSFNFTNSKTGQSGNCFTVGRDEQLPVLVTAANPTQAAGEVVSVWTISAETPGIGAKFEAPLRISFDSETESNNAVALGVFLGLLAMGLLLPLAIMWLINLLTTRFLSVEGTTRAVYPVVADLSGPTPKFTDARQGKTGSIIVEPRDFTAVQDTDSPKTYETGHGSAVARVPAWPLSATWYEWQAPDDSRIISVYPSASISSKDLAAKRTTEVSPNMANNWALTVADSELLKTDKSAVKANLVVFSAMRSLPDYQALVQKNLAESSLKSQFAAAEEAARKDLETQQVKAEKQKPRKGAEASEPTVVPARTSTGAVPPIPGVGGSRPVGPPIPGAAGGSAQPPIPGAKPSSTQPPIPGSTRPMPPIPGANPGSTGSGPNSTPPWKPGQ